MRSATPWLPRVPGAQLLLLNVSGMPNSRIPKEDWGGANDVGFMRYACKDPVEVANANPPLLGLLEEAIRKNGRLGEVVNYLNDLLGKQTKLTPLVYLDPYQQNRRISVPGR